ncbi:hypothetical protein, partial [Arsenophonus endosymbiont of Bemisia tabaci]|uniref:hypothetical protein n=1 Tax=Arsenophonus endosymbiont of Bemisia tabaci TaxID=536059 RepID=UPI001EE2BCB5
ITVISKVGQEAIEKGYRNRTTSMISALLTVRNSKKVFEQEKLVLAAKLADYQQKNTNRP